MLLFFLVVALSVLIVASLGTAIVLATRPRPTFLCASADRTKRASNAPPTTPSRAIGLVIAHPDDECMFFTPTVAHLVASGWQVHVLCLSSGNADGLGRVRTKELDASAKLLGISSVTLIDDEQQLADGMHRDWSPEVIHRHVEAFCTDKKLTTLLTFDDYGISGHPNHISTYHGVRSFLSSQHRDGVVGYELRSTPIWRKYAGVLDAALSWAEERTMAMFSRGSERVHFVSLLQPGLVHRCMVAHASQFVWYRRLFIVFSRYTYVNTLREVQL
jgi:N-acetylglucosaminylphosphatidylinositol deacetylase